MSDNTERASLSADPGIENPGRRSLLGKMSFTATVAGAAGTMALLHSAQARAGDYFNLTGWYDVKVDFAAVGDGVADDTTSFVNAISTAASAQRPLFIPPGTYKITQELAIPSNAMLIGSNHGLNFGCRIRPTGCPAFRIGGATPTFHASIQNLMIWPQGAAPNYIISIDNSYSVTLRNIRIHNAQGNLGIAAVQLLGDPAVGGNGHCNNIIWENLIVRNDAGQPDASAVLASRGCGTHRFVAPDLESYRYLLDWRGGQLELLVPYMENAGTYAVNCNPDLADMDACLSTYGGIIEPAPSGVACAINSSTRNFNSFGTVWRKRDSGYAAYIYGLPSMPAVFHGITPNVTASGASRFSGSPVGWQRGFSFPDLLLKTSKSWNVSVPSGGQASATLTVPSVQVGTHWARANMSIGLNGAQLSAYVSAADTVVAVVQNNTGSAIALNGTLYVECGWM